MNAREFDHDASSGNLPDYVFYVPDCKNDGHDTGVAFADRWYKNRFGSYLQDSAFMEGTVVISTFDESAGGKGNPIYTSIVGPAVKPSTVSDKLDLYSLLRMVEDNWNLGDLGKNDRNASPILSIWK